LSLPNRIVMAPMTRNRAGKGHVPTPLVAEYYRQRATAGLIVTEATQISPRGIGYPNTPGIHSPEQVEGWRVITKAVHEAGGRIVVRARIQHTFPLAMAEIVWGDGSETRRKMFPLTETRPFGDLEFSGEADGGAWKWARFAVWDVAADGAFVNPVWRLK
jgi:2,4-dienoyl-CoA reductase-like NADH-dependent reductase (Old Yellow Enzyme family)